MLERVSEEIIATCSTAADLKRENDAPERRLSARLKKKSALETVNLSDARSAGTYILPTGY